MPSIMSCWNEACEYNRGGCYCDADDIEIDFDDTCLTFEQKLEEA